MPRARTEMAVERKSQKDDLTEKWGPIDGRWHAYRDKRVFWVLEELDLEDEENSMVVIQDPDGNRTEDSYEDFLKLDLDPVSLAKS